MVDGWWKKLLWKPFAEGNWAPMLKVCCKLIWRNSKLDVADEVGVLLYTVVLLGFIKYVATLTSSL